MNDKDALLRQLRVSLEVSKKVIDTYFSTKILDEMMDQPANVIMIFADTVDDDVVLSVKYADGKRHEIIVESGHWAESVLNSVKMSGARGCVWNVNYTRGQNPVPYAGFILRELTRLELVKVLVIENNGGDINAYVGVESDVNNKAEKILSEEWNNAFGDEDPYNEEVGITDEMKDFLRNTGFSAITIDGECAW